MNWYFDVNRRRNLISSFDSTYNIGSMIHYSLDSDSHVSSLCQLQAPLVPIKFGYNKHAAGIPLMILPPLIQVLICSYALMCVCIHVCAKYRIKLFKFIWFFAKHFSISGFNSLNFKAFKETPRWRICSKPGKSFSRWLNSQHEWGKLANLMDHNESSQYCWHEISSLDIWNLKWK